MVDYATAQRLTVAQIQAAVCLEWGVTQADMASRQSRGGHVSRARQVAMYLARQMLREKVMVLAMDFGLTDHSTIVVNVKRVTKRMATDPFLALRVKSLEARLQSPELVEHF